MPKKGQHIEIQLSKLKILLILLSSMAIVALGIWLAIYPLTNKQYHRYSRTTFLIAVYFSIIFFGIGVLIFIRKLIDNRPGLIIDDLGLIDNSSGVSSGQILWSDISNISVLQIKSQKFIMLQVKNPQDYINKQTSMLKRKIMELSFKMYGSPLSITSTALKISFDKLHKLIVDNYNASRQSKE